MQRRSLVSRMQLEIKQFQSKLLLNPLIQITRLSEVTANVAKSHENS